MEELFLPLTDSPFFVSFHPSTQLVPCCLFFSVLPSLTYFAPHFLEVHSKSLESIWDAACGKDGMQNQYLVDQVGAVLIKFESLLELPGYSFLNTHSTPKGPREICVCIRWHKRRERKKKRKTERKRERKREANSGATEYLETQSVRQLAITAHWDESIHKLLQFLLQSMCVQGKCPRVCGSVK